MLHLIKRKLLKYTLLVDGIVSITAGAVFLGLSAMIAETVGSAFTSGIVMALGAILVPWGLFHLAIGREGAATTGAVRIAIAGDALWVLASAVVLIAGWNSLTAVGVALIAVQALAVTDIMLLKMKGLSDQRRMAMT